MMPKFTIFAVRRMSAVTASSDAIDAGGGGLVDVLAVFERLRSWRVLAEEAMTRSSIWE
jgi:hypothetical protein